MCNTGVGKESDVYIAANDNEDRFALKLHRLGRVCFRKVHDKRDYHLGNNKVNSWIYLSRLAAHREYEFLKALHERGFPVPKPFDYNRHCVVMELIDGTLLNNLNLESISVVSELYDKLMNLILSLANEFGLVHGDFNEFNIMIHNETNEPILIDFPQMISVNHRLAKEYFNRDVGCVCTIFKKRYNYEAQEKPTFDKDVILDEEKEDKIDKIDKIEDENEFMLIKSQDNTESYEPLTTDLEYQENEEVSSLHEADERQSLEYDFDGVSSIVSSKQSKATYSVAGSTFSCQYIREKLKKEHCHKVKREEIKRAMKNIKGEDCALRRKRRQNNERIKEDIDLVEFMYDGF